MGQKDKLSDKKLAKKVLESAQEIWLAGLSAFEKAEKEGNKLFDNLVEEGRKVESRTRKIAGDAFDQVKNTATSNWDNLEQVFENRVSQTLQQLGVPGKNDINTLHERIEALDSSVTALIETRQQNAAESISPERKNDLKKITGIGKAYEQRLNAQGVFTFRQIADWDDEEIDRIEKLVIGERSSGRIRQAEWVAQAKELCALETD